MTTLRSGALALLLGGATILQAQGPVDIGLFQNEGQLEVRVRPSADFDGIFSSVVFTLRWDRSTKVKLGEGVQPEGPRTYIPIAPSGGLHASGSFNYQVYAGFGFEPVRSWGKWEAGREYTVYSIPFTGEGTVELVNDAWTGEMQNNGDYYLSLGGLDLTGEIFHKSVNANGADGAVTILPNPNDGRFLFSFPVAAPSDLQVEVVNTLGQSVFSEEMRGFEGTYRKEMDLRTASNGIYYLKITRNGTVDVHKIVYR